MTQDYAKKHRTKQHRNTKQSNSNRIITPLRLLVIVLIIVVFAGFFYWLMPTKHADTKHQVKTKTSVTVATVQASKPLPPVESIQPNQQVVTQSASNIDYQFYTMLPSMQVNNPEQQTQHQPGTAPGFWLQMAVYYRQQDANAMVERLQLLGLNPDIMQRVSEQSQRLRYYVVLGPYTTKTNALNKQQDLQQLQLDSMIYQIS